PSTAGCHVCPAMAQSFALLPALFGPGVQPRHACTGARRSAARRCTRRSAARDADRCRAAACFVTTRARPRLTAAVIALDEERMLADCVRSLAVAVECLGCVDAATRGRTREIAPELRPRGE